MKKNVYCIYFNNFGFLWKIVNYGKDEFLVVFYLSNLYNFPFI